MRRLVVTVAVTLTTLVVTAGVSVATTAAAPARYVDTVFANVNVRSDITYGTAIDVQTHLPVALKLDMYTPVGDRDVHRPAIIWIHGGSFEEGDKSSAELRDQATAFAMKGYVNVSINYRLVHTGCVPNDGVSASCVLGITEALQDAQTAVRFLRAHATTFGIDPTRIAMGGSSAGAITALNVGYTHTAVRDASYPGYSSAVEAVESLSGCALGTTPNARGAPALLFHGTADPLLPYSCARRTVARARAAGAKAFLVSFVGEGHVPYVPNRDEIIYVTTLFFFRQLNLAHGR